MAKTKIGVVGCGVISGIYLENLTTRFPNVTVAGCADKFPEKAAERAEEYGAQQMTLDEMLADSGIQLILNLTTPQFHAEVSLAALKAGKHVYSEKPLAAGFREAKAIMDEAAAGGLWVGCAPDTFLGAGLQSACKAIDEGWIGRPVAGVAFVTPPGHERWHIDPAFYYQKGGGPNLDMGPYYLTALVAMMGPVKRVAGMSSRAHDVRIVGTGPKAGQRIPVEIDTHYAAVLAFENGAVVTTIMSFDIWDTHLPFLEIYGTTGTIALPDPNYFDGAAMIKSRYDENYEPISPQVPFTQHNLRGLGVAQMCAAIRDGGPLCVGGEMALHVLEVLEAMSEAARTGATVTCKTTCQRPPMLATGLAEAEYGL